MSDFVILGVDPGLQFTGYGVAKKAGRTTVLINCGTLKLAPNKDLAARINIFYDFFTQLIIAHQIQVLALETPFLGKNAQNFLKLGYLRGILYLLANQHNLKILEFAPTQVKQAVTGYGGASKEQVAKVIRQLFPKLDLNQLLKTDTTDALAVMLCGLWQN